MASCEIVQSTRPHCPNSGAGCGDPRSGGAVRHRRSEGCHELHGPRPAPVAQYSAGYGLDAPIAASMAGSDLFVANQLGNSVTEINASSGAHVATIAGRSFGLNQPRAITSDGADLFVANGVGNTVTEIDPTNRSLVRIISGFSDPLAMATESAHLYVLNGSGSVTEVSQERADLLELPRVPSLDSTRL